MKILCLANNLVGLRIAEWLGSRHEDIAGLVLNSPVKRRFGAEIMRAPRSVQDETAGTYHTRSDVAAIDEIDLNREYKGRDLLNILRARTFRPYEGAYFMDRGREVFMRMELLDEDEVCAAGDAPEERRWRPAPGCEDE